LIAGGVAIAAQATAVLVCDWLLPALGLGRSVSLDPVSIPANGFGMFLVMAVICDSNARTISERQRLDLERARTMQVTADLAALRARIRPHFLFNTLTALASLCATDPAQAERSILKLGRMMRRTLAVQTSSLTNLEAEIEYVKAYVDIQTLRFGGRVETVFQVDPIVLPVLVPAFSLQTLIENAYQHGFGNTSGAGLIRIVVRPSGEQVLLAVQDNGVGMAAASWSSAVASADLPQHGMGIIDKELRLLFGPSCRLRVLSVEGKGTVVAFRVPRGGRTEVHQA
jgi:LytS/YehU family sensor histidine kinase